MEDQIQNDVTDQVEDTNQDTETKPEKKAKASATLTCTSVHKIAWNIEESSFENDTLKVLVTVKDPALQGKFVVGKKYSKIL